ncbi:MAG: DegQ family serine endoprotease [Candidatus Thiodiazotropha sp.]
MKSRIFNHLFLITISLFMISAQVHAQEGGLENLRQTGKAFASVARSVSPSVVFIQVETTAQQPSNINQGMPFSQPWPFGDDMLKRFFGDQYHGSPHMTPRQSQPQQRRAIGQGSGFIFATQDGLLSDKSYILTNNHVVENADKIRVKLQDGREFEAKVTGRDPQSDVAVIEIPTGGVPALNWGDSAELEVGEWVVAIGNPFGLSHTLTVGVVSAKGRTGVGINDYEDFIQTDAAINPGNSGGPLVNLDGQVVGMNTAIFSRSGGYMGVGFAIPSNLARAIANQLIERGSVTRGFLGIVIQQLTPELAESFAIEPGQGILVAQVSEDSPASRAGIKQGDVILNYQGKPVSSVGNFRNQVALTPPGESAQLGILRDGKSMQLDVSIGELTQDKRIAQNGTQTADELGLTVQTLTPELADQFGARAGEGVVVSEVRPGSIAALAGIDPGTVILQANRRSLSSAAEFEQAVNQSRGQKRILLLIRKGGMQRYLALNW